MNKKWVQMLWQCVRLILFLTTSPSSGWCANILFYFGVSGHSQLSSIWPAIVALGDREHSITILTSILPKYRHSAVSVVHVPEILDVYKHVNEEDLIKSRMNGNEYSIDWMQIGLDTCATMLSAPSSQSVVHNSSFDLVIMDTIVNECVVGLATLKYNCPFIIYNSMSTISGYHDDLGVLQETSWAPVMGSKKPVIVGFVDRLVTTVHTVIANWVWHMDYFPKLSQIFVENLNLTQKPNFGDIMKRTSLMLINAYHTHSYSVSLPPLVVSIAGVGIQEKMNPLPKQLSEFVDSCKDGFIYVGFGTIIRFSKTRPELRQKFFNVFESMPNICFVWKWDDEERPIGAPSNIYFAKWMPQQDLLAHPKARGFITHGGTNGLNEGVHFGVPMLVFPTVGDGDFNAHALVAKELGILMEITNFTEDQLRKNLHVILFDEGLKARVKKASNVFQDRPMKPVDTAVWWIEYVLRHGNTSFLMPAGVHNTWYERRLIDVWFFVFTLLILLSTSTLYMVWKLFIYISSVKVNAYYSSNLKKIE